MDFNEEGQPKGFLVVTFEGKSAHTEFLETPAQKFMTIGPDFLEQDGWRDLVGVFCTKGPKGIFQKRGVPVRFESDFRGVV
jgi:hypothetical protein